MIPQYYKKRFTIELAKADRKCRGKNCKSTIKKGTYCMSINQLEEIPVPLKSYPTRYNEKGWRIVNKKLSYCPKCSVLHLKALILGLENERDYFESLIGRISPYGKNKYRGLIVGEE